MAALILSLWRKSAVDKELSVLEWDIRDIGKQVRPRSDAAGFWSEPALFT